MSWADAAITTLLKGDNAIITPLGNSMQPLIESGDHVELAPPTGISIGKIVLVKVKGKVYLHLVKAVRKFGEKDQYQIGNNKGHINGWVTLDKIYGVAIRTSNKPFGR